MPLHLEKVRDKLAENIHELWGMNKIELGWSYGKVRSSSIWVGGRKKKKKDPHSGIHEHFFSVCGETNITAERFFFFQSWRCLSCKTSLKCISLLAPFSSKQSHPKPVRHLAFSFIICGSHQKQRVSGKTHTQLHHVSWRFPPRSCETRQSFPFVCSLCFSRSH